MKYKIVDFWVICMLILTIQVWTMPACINYNMDLNNIPKTKTEIIVKNTRFSYINDFFKPLGMATVLGVGMSILSPIMVPVLGIAEYKLLTNKVNYYKDIKEDN